MSNAKQEYSSYQDVIAFECPMRDHAEWTEQPFAGAEVYTSSEGDYATSRGCGDNMRYTAIVSLPGRHLTILGAPTFDALKIAVDIARALDMTGRPV